MKTHAFHAVALVLLLGACNAPPPPPSAAATDAAAIVAQMRAIWEKPETPLDAGPVAVEGDHAVADWTQGARGGRALLRREHGQWVTVLCAGDGIRSAEGLQAVGVPAAEATALAAKLAKAEQAVPAERLARMSAFLGVVRMQQGDSAHGPGH